MLIAAALFLAPIALLFALLQLTRLFDASDDAAHQVAHGDMPHLPNELFHVAPNSRGGQRNRGR